MSRRLVAALAATAVSAASTAWGQTCWGVPVETPGAAVVLGVGAWESDVMIVGRPLGRLTVRAVLHSTGIEDVGSDNAWLLGGSLEWRRRAVAVCPLVEVGRHGIGDGDPRRVAGVIGRMGAGIALSSPPGGRWRGSAYVVPQYTVVRTEDTYDLLFGLQKRTDERGALGIEGGVIGRRGHFFGALLAGKLRYTAQPLRDDGHLALRLGWIF